MNNIISRTATELNKEFKGKRIIIKLNNNSEVLCGHFINLNLSANNLDAPTHINLETQIGIVEEVSVFDIEEINLFQ